MYNNTKILYNFVVIVKPSEFRRRFFELMDRCLATGESIDIPRDGGLLRLIPVSRRVPVGQLPRRPGVVVDGESLDSFTPAEWKP